MCCDDGCVNECTWYCGSKSPLRGFLLRLMVTNLPPSPLPPSPLTLSLPSPRAWCAAMSTCLRCFLRNASEPVREPRPRNPLPPRCAATWTKQEKNFDICFFCICTSYADRVLLLTSYFIEVDVRVLHHPTHTYYGVRHGCSTPLAPSDTALLRGTSCIARYRSWLLLAASRPLIAASLISCS